jgi:REP element-mobilizing transposase RayT
MTRESFYIYQKNLPHWRQEGVTYFVTWRIHKSRAELTPKERERVAGALRHFDGERYRLWAYVVMNDHVHVLVQPLPNHDLQEIVQAWKSYTAHVISDHGKSSRDVWQDEYFDRIVRDESEYLEKMGYILGNPRKRWPELEDYPWLWMAQE